MIPVGFCIFITLHTLHKRSLNRIVCEDISSTQASICLKTKHYGFLILGLTILRSFSTLSFTILFTKIETKIVKISPNINIQPL